MAKNLNSASQFDLNINSRNRIAKPGSEFYSIFSPEEVLEIIHALEVRREIPLKYSYKGKGGKIWDNFYLKYIVPTWYRTANVEIDLLNQSFELINNQTQSCKKVNIIDVGAGNSYPPKKFVSKLNKLGRIHKYVALDISDELLNSSQANFQKWFPAINYSCHTHDIENLSINKSLVGNEEIDINSNTANIFLHLGVTIGNHHNRAQALKNFRDSMGKNDLLVLTNEMGSNANWDGGARGGCKYHVDGIYEWIKNCIGIEHQDCQLVRKYDVQRDSIVANIRFCRHYTINLFWMDTQKNIEIPAGEEITIWRHHKHQLSELQQEVEQAGLSLIHYTTNKYSSHIMAICQVK